MKFIDMSAVCKVTIVSAAVIYFVGCGGGLNPQLGVTLPSTAPVIGAAPELIVGTLQTFQDYGDLPVGLSGASALKVGNKFYLIGGDVDNNLDGNKDAESSAIYEATIDGSGNPGSFTVSTWTLSTGRAHASVQVIGSYVYIIGGEAGAGSKLNSIERATLGTNSLTSSFSTQPQTLSTARGNFVSLLTTGYLYVMGGYTNGSNSNDIEVATVNTSTGEIGSFTTMTRTVVDGTTVTGGLVDARATLGSARLGSNFYILGGEVNGSSVDTIEKVTINSDGTLGNFVKITETLAQPRNRIVAIPMAGRLYVFGGFASGSFISTVESAPVSSNVLTSSFATESGLSLEEAAENGAPLLTSQGFFYFGGYNHTSPEYKTKIQKAPLLL